MPRLLDMRVTGVALLLTLAATAGAAASAQSSNAAEVTHSSPAVFGTLRSPCGPGHATGATSQGVTDSSIHIAYGDDRGFSGDPGLDQEMGDSVKDMIAWCNALGGIDGRRVIGDYYDAAVTNTDVVMKQACNTDFMFVGEGFALDDSAEDTRLGCNLAAVPGFTASQVVSNAYEMFQALPTPANHSAVSVAYQAEKLFGSKAQRVGIYDSTLSSEQQGTAKYVQAYSEAGLKFISHCSVEVDYNGEADYTPFMQNLENCGAQILYVNTTPGTILYGALQADNQIGYHPIWLAESEAYTSGFAHWNTQGLANDVYVRMGIEPFEAAGVVPAVAKYLSIVKKYGGLTSSLGEESASSFLLWATVANECGSDLTRQCVINHLAKVTKWTGGGLNALTDPAKNLPSSCGLLMRLDDTKWVQVYPKKLGEFDCSTKYIVTNSGTVITTPLNSEGYATQFASSSIIEPQG